MPSKDDYLKKNNQIYPHILIWGFISDKRPKEIVIIIPAVNAQVYIEMSDTFSLKSQFGDELFLG